MPTPETIAAHTTDHTMLTASVVARSWRGIVSHDVTSSQPTMKAMKIATTRRLKRG